MKMALLEIDNLTRRFASGGGVSEIKLAIDEGELFVLLGPSGSGKSTLLRLIAGLENPDSGEIRLAGHTPVPRDAVAMVFQNFALYPHLSAFDNVAFPLRLRRLRRPQIESRVAEAAKLASLSVDLRRRPGELSGGERQRVALARALVRQPQVILMDEPLSSLDAQLRNRLRTELKEFQRRAGRTVIYVTHDQLEALTLADRMAVMRSGQVEQVGPPDEVYRHPANLFVATFLGQPPMNILRCQLTAAPKAEAGALSQAPTVVRLADGQMLAITPPADAGAGEFYLGFRPEQASAEAVPDTIRLELSFDRSEFVGGGYMAYAHIAEQPVTVLLKQEVAAGARREVYIARSALHLFDSASERRLP